MAKKKIDKQFEKLVKAYAKKTYNTERVARRRLLAAARGESIPTQLLTPTLKINIGKFVKERSAAAPVKRSPKRTKTETVLQEDFLVSFNKYAGGRGKASVRATFKISSNTTTRFINLYLFPDEIKAIQNATNFDEAFKIWVSSNDGDKFLNQAEITNIERKMYYTGVW